MHRSHVWSYDFGMDETVDGRAPRMLMTVDEFTRECLAIDVARKLTSEDVLERLSDLAIVLLLIGCLPSAEFHLIKAPENRVPPQNIKRNTPRKPPRGRPVTLRLK
jgi:hypothetical protein